MQTVYQISHDSNLDPKLIALALRTLGTFDFSPHVLTEMVRESIVNYLDDDNPQIRAEAAKVRFFVFFQRKLDLNFACLDLHKVDCEARADCAGGWPRRRDCGRSAGKAADCRHCRSGQVCCLLIG